MLDTELVASIYEAGAIPERWPDVLHRLALTAGAQAAALVAVSPGNSIRAIPSQRYAEGFQAFAAKAHLYDNPRPRRSLEIWPGGFVTDLEVCTPEELAVDLIYEDYLRPYGLAHTSGTVIPVPGGDLLTFDVSREPGPGPFTRADMQILDQYRPHLARAALMASRLGLERARAASEAMEAIGLPCASIAADGTVMAANGLFEALAPRIVFTAHGKAAIADRPANQLFGRALQDIASDSTAVPRSIPLAARDDGPAMIVHVVPIRREAHDVFTASVAMLIVATVTALEMPSTGLLHGLFDLTPAETRIAQALVNGRRLGELASQTGVSVETLRTQLKSVMGKTGTRRQVDLVRLLVAAHKIDLGPHQA